MDASPQFKPRKLTNAEFQTSNVFAAWSRKIGREVRLIGPNQYDAWLQLEFDPEVVWFCERPPIYIELLPLVGKKRAVDFWVRQRTAKQLGVVLHDVALARDKSCPVDLLKRSIEQSKLMCEVWQAADMRSRTIYLRNLKQLQPFLAMDQQSDEQLAASILAHVHQLGKASWSELLAISASRYEGIVHYEIARLIHSGRLKANLAEHPLASNTLLTLPSPP